MALEDPNIVGSFPQPTVRPSRRPNQNEFAAGRGGAGESTVTGGDSGGHLEAFYSKFPRQRGSRPSEPHIGFNAYEEQSVKLTPEQEADNDLARKAAVEFDSIKKNQEAQAPSTAPTGGAKIRVVPIKVTPTFVGLPKRPADAPKFSEVMQKLNEHLQTLKAYHAGISSHVEKFPIAKQIHSNVQGGLDEVQDQLKDAQDLYAKRQSQLGNEIVHDLAKSKTLSQIHSALVHPDVRAAVLHGSRNTEDAIPALPDGEDIRKWEGIGSVKYEGDTPRREGKPYSKMKVGQGKTKMYIPGQGNVDVSYIEPTEELERKARELEAQGVIGSAETEKLIRARKGTQPLPPKGEISSGATFEQNDKVEDDPRKASDVEPLGYAVRRGPSRPSGKKKKKGYGGPISQGSSFPIPGENLDFKPEEQQTKKEANDVKSRRGRTDQTNKVTVAEANNKFTRKKESDQTAKTTAEKRKERRTELDIFNRVGNRVETQKKMEEGVIRDQTQRQALKDASALGKQTARKRREPVVKVTPAVPRPKIVPKSSKTDKKPKGK